MFVKPPSRDFKSIRVGAIMTAKAAYLITSWPIFSPEITCIDGFCHLNRTQWSTGTCCTMTISTTRCRCSAIFVGFLMRTNPGIAGCMHAMRAAIDSSRYRSMAGFTLCYRAGMSLNSQTLGIIINMTTWIFSMGRTMTSFALQTAVSGTEAVQVQACDRRISIGCKGMIRR